jgi:hypothetical protein
VAVEEGELIAALVKPGEFVPRVHQPQQELPGLAPLPADLHYHFEKIDLRFARAMHQRHVNLGPLAAPLPPIVTHQGPADLIAFRPKLAMQQHRSDSLLAGGSRLPLRHQFLQPWLHRFPYRPSPWPSAPAHRFRLLQILGYRVAADSEFARHPPHTPALVQHLVSQYMHLIHLQHPRPPASRRSLWPGVAHF